MENRNYNEESYHFNNVYEDEKIKIFTICGTAWINKFQYISKKLKKNHYIFTMDWSFTENKPHENPIDLIKNCEYPENITFMSNVTSSNIKRIENGFNSILCNHNTFINTNIFDIKSEHKKKYNMVINSRAKDWKNIHLAKEVDNTALIINRWNIENHRGKNSDDYLKLNYSYLNKGRLQQHQVSEIVNQSYTGGIFSFNEGACYSSSEYLLCGIPVVSTKSLGGRDVYYDDYNSVIVEPNENEVKYACEKLIRERKEPIEIRNRHLKIIKEHENNLINEFQKIFDENDINKKASDWFYENKNSKWLEKHNHFMKAEGCAKKIKDIIEILN